MNLSEAKFIKILRLEFGCTWGRIGELWELYYFTEEHGGQLLGRELVREAADTLKEHEESWD